MTAQPKTMDELVRSIVDTTHMNPGAVISTLATMPLDAIANPYKVAAQAYQAHALVLGNGIGNYGLGAKVEIGAQTDIFFMGLDRDGQFGRMVGIITTVGKRTR